jgi:predicted negative regulator of RcsB-dependent stress response
MPTVPSRSSTIEPQFFWDTHKNEILAALVIVFLAIAGFVGYRIYSTQRDSSAAELLAAAKKPEDFQKVINQFSGTPACATAYLLLANEQRNGKKFAEANMTLEQFVAKFPKHELVTTAHMGMAANLESLGRKDDALTTYQRLIANYPKDFNVPLAMLSQVHLLVETNKIEEARRLCENIMTQYRQGPFASEAARQLHLLGPGKAPEPPAQTLTPTTAIPPDALPPPAAAPSLPPKPANPTPKKP